MAINSLLYASSEYEDNERYPEIDLLAHCSCGKHYLIKEKPNSFNEAHSTKCPECKDVSHIKYIRSGKGYDLEITTFLKYLLSKLKI